MTLIYFSNFIYLNYVKFIHFLVLLEAKIMKKIQQFTLKYLLSKDVSPIFIPNLNIHFLFLMYKICEILSFSYVAG